MKKYKKESIYTKHCTWDHIKEKDLIPTNQSHNVKQQNQNKSKKEKKNHVSGNKKQKEGIKSKAKSKPLSSQIVEAGLEKKTL